MQTKRLLLSYPENTASPCPQKKTFRIVEIA